MMDEPLPEIVMTSRSGISGIRIMQKKKVKIEHKWTSNVSNCKMLPNGRLIFIDTENKRLVIHNKDTYVYRNLRVSDPPRDFTVLDSDRVAVTFGIYIEILNIVTSRMRKEFIWSFSNATEYPLWMENSIYTESSKVIYCLDMAFRLWTCMVELKIVCQLQEFKQSTTQ